MEEIKVNDYCRTNSGQIFKVSKTTDLGINNVFPHNENGIMIVTQITKHSSNIIDLIEEGDYVNGHLVIAVDREKLEVSIENCMYGSDYEDINGNIDIKSIVTKEQFNSIKYVIGE